MSTPTPSLSAAQGVWLVAEREIGVVTVAVEDIYRLFGGAQHGRFLDRYRQGERGLGVGVRHGNAPK